MRFKDQLETSSRTVAVGLRAINGLAYHEVHFRSDGSLDIEGVGDGGLSAFVANGRVEDLFVFSHGWNNGIDSARGLYHDIFELMADLLGPRKSTSAVVGIIWPSILFPDDDPLTASSTPSAGSELAASLAPAFPDRRDILSRIGNLLDSKPKDPDKIAEFHKLTTALVTTPPQSAEDDGEAALLDADVFTALGHASQMAPRSVSDAQAVQDLYSGLWSAGRELLRGLSYYEMKNRAGIVGKNGLGPLLANLRGPEHQPRIHLMGHSFGARLVSYALAGLPDSNTGRASPVKSLTLIQGAFSHFAFAPSLPFDARRAGGLAGLESRVDGPLLATFSRADRAVGRWYPAASMLAGHDTQAVEERAHRWGAMGHDGFQHNPPADTIVLKNTGVPYGFMPGRFYRLDANAVISTNLTLRSGAHSDIRHPQVVWATVSAAGIR